MPKATEFGVMIEASSVGDYVTYAELAKQLGFGTFWVPEDPGFGGAFAIAGAIAARTTTIKVGLGVVNPFLRHPAVLAMEIGALDHLSGGRAILGLGASVKQWIERQLGVPYAQPLTAIREAVEIIRGLIRGEMLDYRGKVFQASNVRLNFKPVRRDIPIHLGVMAPKALALAGEIADCVQLNGSLAPDFIRDAIERTYRGAASRGRSLNDFAMGHFMLVAISKDGRSARESLNRTSLS